MARLGYDRYEAQAGDTGAIISPDSAGSTPEWSSACTRTQTLAARAPGTTSTTPGASAAGQAARTVVGAASCVLAERIHALLAGPDGSVSPQLRPLVDVIGKTERRSAPSAGSPTARTLGC